MRHCASCMGGVKLRESASHARGDWGRDRLLQRAGNDTVKKAFVRATSGICATIPSAAPCDCVTDRQTIPWTISSPQGLRRAKPTRPFKCHPMSRRK